jgi:hypothetical protein
VGGETVIISPGGCVVRARDGKVVLRDLGWSGYGNAAGVLEDPAGSGAAFVVFNMGCRRTTPRTGHHVRAYRLERKGDTYHAEKLWEWGWEGLCGVSVSSPVIVPSRDSGRTGGKVFLGGSQGYVFDLLRATPLIAPSPAVAAEWHEWSIAWRDQWRKQNDGQDPPDLTMHNALYRKHGQWRRSHRGFVPRELTQHRYLNPIAAGRHLYLAQEDGSVVVLATKLRPTEPKKEGWPAWQPVVVARSRLDPEGTPYGRSSPRSPDPSVQARWLLATPQVWENCLYIRQNGWLWCIGKK